MATRYQRLCAAELAQRQTALPKLGTASTRVHQLEAAIRFSLGSKQQPDDNWLCDALLQAKNGVLLAPPVHWRKRPTPFLPVPLWRRPAAEMPGLRLRWLKRKMHRSTQGRQKPLSSPRFDPQQQPPPSLTGKPGQAEYVYREWDYQRCAYKPDWCRVSEHVPRHKTDQPLAFDASIDVLAHQVRRQFEALRQVSGWNRYLENGEEVDIDAFVDAFGDKRGCGMPGSGLYRSRAHCWRDLSVAVLLDISRSTQAWVGTLRAIDIARQSMAVLAEALAAVGDDFALYGFASDSRLRVRFDRWKDFGERYGERSRRSLLVLTPADYTRMGAAIRHAGNHLQQRSCRQKMLLVLTDGRPHDPTDRYEGRYAVEDTRRSLLELRARGMHCFGLTIDQYGQDYLPYLFGPGHYAVFSHPRSLPNVLPRLYARITGLVA
ncbi:MAG: VWA domain-containing protein [Candidatus Competibacteraceae bacterium]|nr:VWA domain-containing protein [Candidatus Competibacteraceae bacterium]